MNAMIEALVAMRYPKGKSMNPFLFLYVSIFCLACRAEITLETYGDSLTAGMLSNTNVTQVDSLSSVETILEDFASYSLTHDPKYISPHEVRSLAWPMKLSTWLHTHTVHNHAVSGARVEHIPSQVEGASLAPAFAFFFIGHNNLCANVATEKELEETIYHHMNKTLEMWDSKHLNSRAYLLPVGDIPGVYETLSKHVWYSRAGKVFTCENSWTRFFPYCRMHFEKFKKDELRAYLSPRIRAMNQALNHLSEQWNGRSKKNSFEYLKMLEGIELKKNYFALDCYHLSEAGQQTLAEQVYRGISGRL